MNKNNIVGTKGSNNIRNVRDCQRPSTKARGLPNLPNFTHDPPLQCKTALQPVWRSSLRGPGGYSETSGGIEWETLWRGWSHRLLSHHIESGSNRPREHEHSAAKGVLQAPRYDGSNFVVTSDGCAEGFAAVLSQRTRTQNTAGKWTERLHPIGFASKRTSSTEQNYKPFLLEFAALKFALDKFSDIIWGFPVEVETDCQAQANST